MKEIGEEIKRIAPQFDLDPLLIAAIVLQESSGNPFAFRYEPAFFARYIKRYSKKDLRGRWPTSCGQLYGGDSKIDFLLEQKERTLRACSFGLMQIMGQVARELGFSHYELFDLFDVEQNITYGCKKLAGDLAVIKKLVPYAPQDVVTAKLLRRYNGGGNPNYAAFVITWIKSGEAAKLFE